MRVITIHERQSKFARLLIAANTLSFDRFLTFQEKECGQVGALQEKNIVQQLARELGIAQDLDYSKYREFLKLIWIEAMRSKVIVVEGAFEGDTGATMGMGVY